MKVDLMVTYINDAIFPDTRKVWSGCCTGSVGRGVPSDPDVLRAAGYLVEAVPVARNFVRPSPRTRRGTSTRSWRGAPVTPCWSRWSPRWSNDEQLAALGALRTSRPAKDVFTGSPDHPGDLRNAYSCVCNWAISGPPRSVGSGFVTISPSPMRTPVPRLALLCREHSRGVSVAAMPACAASPDRCDSADAVSSRDC